MAPKVVLVLILMTLPVLRESDHRSGRQTKTAIGTLVGMTNAIGLGDSGLPPGFAQTLNAQVPQAE
ncbi:MAG: hypothetical protein ABGX10_15100 [Paracoccus sp. (in: a-proteobacteria)]